MECTRQMMSPVFRYRQQRELPFYCHPVLLFITSWLSMLIAFQFHVSYSSYSGNILPLVIFATSLLFVLAGYAFIRAIYYILPTPPPQSCAYRIDLDKLKRMNLVLALAALSIMVYNCATNGLPPVFSFIGFDTKVYAEYGRFKQILFPLLAALFVNSLLDPSKMKKTFFFLFATLGMIFYVARGPMMQMLFEALIVFSVRTSKKKRYIYLSAAAVLVIAALLMTLLGNSRTGKEFFFLGMQIDLSYWNWPMGFLWIASYISVPLSNLCWIIHYFHFDHVTLSFLGDLLPSFWKPEAAHESFIADHSEIIDGVHTYLASYFMDFSYLGLLFPNFLIGMGCGYVLNANRISRKFLTSSIFVACIAFLFFFDMFIYLPTIVQFCIQAFAQRYFVRDLPLGSE